MLEVIKHEAESKSKELETGKKVKRAYNCTECSAGTRLAMGCDRLVHLDGWDLSRMEKGLAKRRKDGRSPPLTCPVPLTESPEAVGWLDLIELVETGALASSGVRLSWRDWRAISKIRGGIKRYELEKREKEMKRGNNN